MLQVFRDLHRAGRLSRWSLAVSGRLALSIASVAILFLGSQNYGSFAAAGALSATFGVALVLTTPLRCALVDRRGWRALQLTSLLFSGMVGLCAVMAVVHAPIGLALMFSGLAGATTPPWGPAIKAELSRAVVDETRKRAVFAVDSATEDIVYSSGPAVAALVTSAWSAPAAVGLVAIISAVTAVFVGVLPAEARSVPLRRERAPRRQFVGWVGMPGVLLPALAVGLILGSVEILAPSRTGTVSAGAALSALAVGSVLGSLLYGSIRMPKSSVHPGTLVLILVGALSLSTAALALATTAWSLIALYFALGVLIGPTVTSLYLVIDSVDSGSATSAGWVNAMLNGGAAIATAVVGLAIGAVGDFSSIAVGIAFAGLTMVVVGMLAGKRGHRATP